MKKNILLLLIALFSLMIFACEKTNKDIEISNEKTNITENSITNENTYSGYEVSNNNFNENIIKNKELLNDIENAKIFDCELGIIPENEITFGTNTNKNTSSTWIVLDKKDGKALLMQKDNNISMSAYSETVRKYYDYIANDTNHKYHDVYLLFDTANKAKEKLYNEYKQNQNDYDEFYNTKEYKDYEKLLYKIYYTEFFIYLEEKMKESVSFSEDENKLICDTTIYTRHTDIENDMGIYPISSKYFVLSSDDYHKYFGLSDEEYKNEKALLVKNTILRDIGFDTTFGVGRMFINDEGYLDMQGISPSYMKYLNMNFTLKPCIYVQYKNNDKDTYVYNNDDFKRLVDKNYLKEKIKNTESLKDKKNKNLKDNEKIKFGGRNWYLLKKDSNKALLMLDDIYENKVFYKKYKNKLYENLGSDWEDSILRRYLNTKFYNQFTDEEKKMIVPQVLHDGLNDSNYLESGPTIPNHLSTDKVFLLSPYEICAYFGDKVDTDLLNIKLKCFEKTIFINNIDTMFLRSGNKAGGSMKKSYNAISSNNEFAHIKKTSVAGIRPCIVIIYDEEYKKIVDEYDNIDKKIDVKSCVYNVKEKLKEEIGEKGIKTFHYVGDPSNYYDNEFLYNEYIPYYIKNEYEDENIKDYKYVRSLYSDILGRCDIIINDKNKQFHMTSNINYNFPKNLINKYNEKYKEKSISTKEFISRVLEFYVDPLDKKAINENIKSPVNKRNSIYKIKDKVTFGNIDGLPLIWTVVDINDDNTIKICSDYTFDFETELNIWDREKERSFNSFFNGDELDIIFEYNDNRYEYMDYENFDEIFNDENSRVSLGCLNNTFRGYKSYKVGGKGKYKHSTYAVDFEGKYYNVYDYKILPRKICINVTENIVKLADMNYKIYNYIDNYDYSNDQYGKDYVFLDNIFNKHLCEYEDELVDIDGKIKYIDYGGIEKDIIELNELTKNSLNIGDIVSFGNFVDYKDNEKNDKIQMLYRVQDINGTELYLDSVYSINTYTDEDAEVSFEKSKIRSWLNSVFYNSSFTDSEKVLIKFKNIVFNEGFKDEKSFTDKVYLVSDENDSVSKYMMMNMLGLLRKEESILSGKCIVDEYDNLNSEQYSDALKKDRYIKLMSDYSGIFKSNYVRTYIDRGNHIYILPSLTIDLDKDDENGKIVPYNIYNRLDKCIIQDNNMYYIDKNYNLNLIENYDSNKKYKNEDIKKLGEKVEYLYYRNGHILFLSKNNISYNDLYEVYNIDKVKKIDKNVWQIITFNNANNEITYYINAREIDNKIDGTIKKYSLTITDYLSKDENDIIDNSFKTERQTYVNLLEEYGITVGKDNYIDIDDDLIEEEEIFLDSLDSDKYIIYDTYYSLNIKGDEYYATIINNKFYLYGIYGNNLTDGIFLAYRNRENSYISIDMVYIKNDTLFRKTLDKYKGEYRYIDYFNNKLYYERYEGGQYNMDKSIFKLEINKKPSKIIYERNFEGNFYYDYKNDTVYLIDNNNNLHEINKNEDKILFSNVASYGIIDNDTLYVKYLNDNNKVYLYNKKTNKSTYIGEGTVYKSFDNTIHLNNDAKPGETDELFQNSHKLIFDGKVYDIDDKKYGNVSIIKDGNNIYAATIDTLYKLEFDNDKLKYILILSDIYNYYGDVAINDKYIAYKKKDANNKIGIYIKEGDSEKLINTYNQDIELNFHNTKNSIYLEEIDKHSYYKYNLIDLVDNKSIIDDKSYSITSFIKEVYKK